MLPTDLMLQLHYIFIVKTDLHQDVKLHKIKNAYKKGAILIFLNIPYDNRNLGLNKQQIENNNITKKNSPTIQTLIE